MHAGELEAVADDTTDGLECRRRGRRRGVVAEDRDADRAGVEPAGVRADRRCARSRRPDPPRGRRTCRPGSCTRCRPNRCRPCGRPGSSEGCRAPARSCSCSSWRCGAPPPASATDAMDGVDLGARAPQLARELMPKGAATTASARGTASATTRRVVGRTTATSSSPSGASAAERFTSYPVASPTQIGSLSTPCPDCAAASAEDRSGPSSGLTSSSFHSPQRPSASRTRTMTGSSGSSSKRTPIVSKGTTSSSRPLRRSSTWSSSPWPWSSWSSSGRTSVGDQRQGRRCSGSAGDELHLRQGRDAEHQSTGEHDSQHAETSSGTVSRLVHLRKATDLGPRSHTWGAEFVSTAPRDRLNLRRRSVESRRPHGAPMPRRRPSGPRSSARIRRSADVAGAVRRCHPRDARAHRRTRRRHRGPPGRRVRRRPRGVRRRWRTRPARRQRAPRSRGVRSPR